MKRWNPNSVVLGVEITPTWQKVIQAFWIGYCIIFGVGRRSAVLPLVPPLYPASRESKIRVIQYWKAMRVLVCGGAGASS